MGSNLSPAIAYLICEYYERMIPQRIPSLRLRNLFGARYMDDLLLIYIFPLDDNNMKQLLAEDVKMITDTSRPSPIYHKDLKIKPEHDERGAPCLGTLITVHTDPNTNNQYLDIRYLNKNEDAIQKYKPAQTTLRLQHNNSFSSIQQKMGTIIGEITRIKRLTLHTNTTLEQIRILQLELDLLGYERSTIHRVAEKTYRKTGDQAWSAIARHFKPTSILR